MQHYSTKDEIAEKICKIHTDRKSNRGIMKELKTQPLLEKINNYKHKWIHVSRMDRSRLPYAIIKYQQAGKRNPGHPLKRLPHSYIETGTDHGV
jgi:hypothetical protein